MVQGQYNHSFFQPVLWAERDRRRCSILFKDIKMNKFDLLNKIQLLKKNYDFHAGLFLIFISISFVIMSYRVGIGELHNPRAGFFPFCVSILLFVMSFGLLIASIKKNVRSQGENLSDRFNIKTVFLILPVLVMYGVVLDTLGFTITTFLFMVYTVRILGKKRWWVTLLIAFITTQVVHLIFIKWLRCQFPLGIF